MSSKQKRPFSYLHRGWPVKWPDRHKNTFDAVRQNLLKIGALAQSPCSVNLRRQETLSIKLSGMTKQHSIGLG